MKVRRLVLAAGVLPVLALTACGGGANTPSVASAGTPSAAPSGSPSPSGSSDPLKFAQCMREHGIDMKDPEPGGGPVAIRRRAGDDAKWKKAEKECGKYMVLGGPGKGPDDPAVRDAMLKFARCMREHGVNVPDPKPGGGIMIKKDENVDRDAMERARKACEKLLPGAGPGRGPGGESGGGN
ncbi:hypothetical protein ABGB17_04480 [Sphaerisporangium sp. B11E5]|uniref:hypothetical protein n=1 Tax=Sphaerisporangium sp. B11E5 TaxID=3153563 RepID=UPI00325F18CC